jgi:DNA-binding transcriptional LysR family regulator
VAAARSGSIGGAARLIGRTQPSVTARIRSLEESWGVRLFRRGPRGVRLTPEGARLLPRAETALASLAALDEAAGHPASGEEVLRLGTGDALGRALLPPLLARLRERRPAALLEVREGASETLVEAVRAGEVDLVLVSHDPGGGDLEVSTVLESPVALLLPEGHRLDRGRSPLALARLSGEPLVTLQPESAFRRHLAEAFAAAGLAFRPSVEVGSLSLVHRFVAAGLGVAPVPAVAFPEAPAGTASRTRVSGVPPVVYRAVRRGGAPAGELERALLAGLAAARAPGSRKKA